MPELIDPNQKLATDIVNELIGRGLILSANAPGISEALAGGKMKDNFWLAAFDRKIEDLKKTDEA
ncbi:hypothetical protein ACVW0P_002559 [Mucilaginibacter sp. UYNi724]